MRISCTLPVRERNGNDGGIMKARVFLVALAGAIVFLMASGPTAAYGGAPTTQVKMTIDRVLETLKDDNLKKPSKTEERRLALRKIVGERFDFEEMSQRALALHWRSRTPHERKEFISLFSDLLERSYVNKIESYTDEKVLYTEESVDGNYAVVRTRIVTKRNVEVPIDYRLTAKNGVWRVYDVVIEGVSLVNNYRNQFNRIIRSQSYAELVKRLKDKQAEKLFDDKSR